MLKNNTHSAFRNFELWASLSCTGRSVEVGEAGIGMSGEAGRQVRRYPLPEVGLKSSRPNFGASRPSWASMRAKC